MADLQELFSRLKSPAGGDGDTASPQAGSSIWAQPQHGYRQPTVSSPIFSPQVGTPNPTHPTSVLSPAVHTPAPSQDQKAASLLNLLRFNGQISQSSPMSAMQNVGGLSRSDSTPQPDRLFSARPEPRAQGVTSPLGNPQDFLLNLLNQPKQTPSEMPIHAPQPQAPASANSPLPSYTESSLGLGTSAVPGHAEAGKESREPTPVRIFGSAESRDTTPFEAPPATSKSGVFTYVNPFEQLSASSPRHRTPKPDQRATTPRVEIIKPSANAQVQVEDNGKKEVGLNGKSKSVSEALSDVGDKVDKQVEDALAQADGATTAPAVSTSVPADIAKPKATKDVGQTEAADVADSWESAEDASSKGASAVKVFNFPMRPFVAIELKKTMDASVIRSDCLMDIARLKKEFDQIDRTLVTASPSHIIYAMSKNGGFRVIRQDSGRDKQVFKSSSERIFNVQTSSSPEKDADYVLATGVNGSVFWTTISAMDSDRFEDEDLEAQGFVLPPVAVQDDNTSGSPVKTRSKMSSRHPGFFGISRGKSIYLIKPLLARSQKYADAKTRLVDNAKYLADHSLKINTGKACKDFVFSEDDSIVVSLDKAGRIKFWDVRQMRDSIRDGKSGNVDEDQPLMTLTTTMATEKISPTSIMFVDKERPCVKGVALRYLIVGLKQNHVLQLWDLGLNKVVQELHFPHDKDSDAICSIAYHPKTGIIALGHPTRNSIFFVHLSAPRYPFQNLDQARYITALASQDSSLQKPDSTAIMSGIREVSFASKGQLRSIDMLRTPAPNPAAGVGTEETVFELYAMHSKGVTCLNIKKADLGWTDDNKVMHPVDAEKTGHITIGPIRAYSEAPVNTGKPKPSSSEKDEAVKRDVPVVLPAAQSQPSAANGSKKAGLGSEVPEPAAVPKRTVNPPIITPELYTIAAATSPKLSAPEPVRSAVAEPSVAAAAAAVIAGAASVPQQSADSRDALQNGDAIDSLTKEFESLYRKIEDNRRVQDAAASARQDAILRLVSSTLTDNVEKSLETIVNSSVQQSILPSVERTVSSMVEKRLKDSLSTHLGTLVPQEIRSTLPNVVSRALQDKEFHKIISEQTAAKLTPQIQQTLEAVTRNTLLPSLSNIAASTLQKAMTDIETRLTNQAQQADVQRRQDSTKMEQMSSLIYTMSQTIQSMAANQAALSEQIEKLQSQIEAGAQSSPVRAAVPGPSDVVASVEDDEVQLITDLLTHGRYEEGTIKWLQSSRQGELFDRLFVRCNPAYLQRLTPLVTLSVSAAITVSFDKHVNERLEWLDIVLRSIDLKDNEIVQVAPKIMDVLQARLQGAYMVVSETRPGDQCLRKISTLSRQISEIKALTT